MADGWKIKVYGLQVCSELVYRIVEPRAPMVKQLTVAIVNFLETRKRAGKCNHVVIMCQCG